MYSSPPTHSNTVILWETSFCTVSVIAQLTASSPTSEQNRWKEKNRERNCKVFYLYRICLSKFTVNMITNVKYYSQSCRIHCITAEVINPETVLQHVYVLYKYIYNTAVSIHNAIWRAFWHPLYIFFVSPTLPFPPFNSHSSFPDQIAFLYSRMGLLPLAILNTAQACFLIIFSSLHWHWFMRVMLDTPPWPAPTPL